MTVSEQIIQVVDALCEKLGIAIDWTSENVMPYIETLCGKLINYEIGTSIAWIVILAVLSVGCMVATKKFYPVFKNGLEQEKNSYDIGWSFASGISIAGLAIIYLTTIIVIGTQVMDIIKCMTFPEMYVFEYISALVNAG